MGFLSVALCLFTLTVVAFAAFLVYLAFQKREDKGEGFPETMKRVLSSEEEIAKALAPTPMPPKEPMEFEAAYAGTEAYAFGMEGYTGLPLEDADDTEYLHYFDSDGVRNSIGIVPAGATSVKEITMG